MDLGAGIGGWLAAVVRAAAQDLTPLPVIGIGVEHGPNRAHAMRCVASSVMSAGALGAGNALAPIQADLMHFRDVEGVHVALVWSQEFTEETTRHVEQLCRATETLEAVVASRSAGRSGVGELGLQPALEDEGERVPGGGGQGATCTYQAMRVPRPLLDSADVGVHGSVEQRQGATEALYAALQPARVMERVQGLQLQIAQWQGAPRHTRQQAAAAAAARPSTTTSAAPQHPSRSND